MSKVFGTLTDNDTEFGFLANVGQGLAWEVAQKWVSDRMVEFALTTAIFVEDKTEKFKLRYKKPGAGYLQERNAQGTYGSAKATGSWDVAFPLRDKGITHSWNDVDVAKLSAEELSNHIVTGMNSYINSFRHDVLHVLFDNVQESFTDPDHGSLSIEPLANGDTVTYPPVTGEPDTEATEDHYLESGYAAANISDTNNPLATIRDDLDHHYNGPSTGGDNIVVFCNRAQRSQLEGLTEFTEVPDNWIMTGDNVDVPFGLPNAPGKVLGRASGVWVVQWDYVPANYLLGIHLDETPPLLMRHDPLSTGLGTGDFMLVSRDEQFPFESAVWRARYGIGGGNRLNGVAMELGTGGSYTVPTAYD
jgi:hypothetical protein